MNQSRRRVVWHITLIAGLLFLLAGCSQIQVPAIDPTGSRIFLPSPYTTSVLGPGQTANPQVTPYGAQAGSTFGVANGAGRVLPNQYPQPPAFTQPQRPEPCYPNSGCFRGTTAKKHIIPDRNRIKTRGQAGEIIMTPHRIIAPVGSEVVVLAGICGGDGYYVVNQPLEWMLSNNSVGQLIEVGGMDHKNFNRLVPPSAKKFDGQYAWGRTGIKERTLTRGTPTPADDIDLLKGQTFVSLSSASPGTTYLTAVAPKAEGWDKRRASTTIHWVDGIWSIPMPTNATAGTVHSMSTLIKSATDDGGIADWKVKYTIVGGAPAEFAPTGSQTAEAVSGEDGLATVQLRQPAGQFEPGTTQVRVDVIRPAILGERELLVESGVTSVTWSAPALTIRAIGPRQAGSNETFNYRIEVTNPGDQIARGVKVRTNGLTDDVDFISSDPKPTQYGRDYEWDLGDINPGSAPKTINIQFKSSVPGMRQLCFDVSSETDQLQTQACAETEIVAPCIGLVIEGPESASVGDQIQFNFKIVNQCEDALENVVLSLQYDSGLKPVGDFGPVIQANVGKIEFGEQKSLPLVFDVLQPGPQCFTIKVAADEGHTARARQCVQVGQVVTPQLTMQLDGLRLVEVGNSAATVRAKIKNTGSTTLTNVSLINKFSDSLEPQNITRTYAHNWINDELAVVIGTLEPQQEAIVEIIYDANRADGNAFSEFTASSASGASATDKFDIRIEEVGGGFQNGNTQPAQPDFGNQPANPNNAGNNISVPNQGNNTGLQVDVQALDTSVRRSDKGTNNAPNGRFLITVTNNRNGADQNVDITLYVPPGLWLSEFDPNPGGLAIESKSADFSEFYLRRRFEMRPGEQLQFTAFIAGDVVGEGTFEVGATSDNTVGSVRDNASIQVIQ